MKNLKFPGNGEFPPGPWLLCAQQLSYLLILVVVLQVPGRGPVFRPWPWSPLSAELEESAQGRLGALAQHRHPTYSKDQ